MSKKTLVVLTGAGVSAESGLKTFRDSDGLWNNYKVEDVATATAWDRNPGLVLEFYNMRRKDAIHAQPNAAHRLLAELEDHFDVKIVTTNVDDLHERAGSTDVTHLHGELTLMRGEDDDDTTYPYIKDIHLGDLSRSGAQLRPHIVWFEENVPMLNVCENIVRQADIVVVIGTSLQVYPAASLIHKVQKDAKRFIIDKKIPNKGEGRWMMAEWIEIEKPATEGVAELVTLLEQYKSSDVPF
jgi:NAD-dependent deacetylase